MRGERQEDFAPVPRLQGLQGTAPRPCLPNPALEALPHLLARPRPLGSEGEGETKQYFQIPHQVPAPDPGPSLYSKVHDESCHRYTRCAAYGVPRKGFLFLTLL